jgi:hypothetical protein
MLGATAGLIRMSADLGTVSAVYDGTALPGPAARLLSVTPHPDTITVDVPLPAPVRVRLADAYGNLVRTSGVRVRARRTGVTSTTAFADSATTDTAGVASIMIPPYRGLIGQLALTLAASGLDSLTKPVTVLTGAPSQLGFVSAWPAATATGAGTAIAPQPALQLYDVGGNPTSVPNVTVTATRASGPTLLPVLAGATAITSATGRAVFNGLSIGGTAGTYTLRFAAGTYTPVVSGNVSIVAGVAASLSMVQQPPPQTVAGPLSPAPSVRVADAFGNGVAGVVVSVAGAGGLVSAVTGTLTATTNASGVATFNQLSLVGVALNGALVFTMPTPALSVTSAPISLL